MISQPPTRTCYVCACFIISLASSIKSIKCAKQFPLLAFSSIFGLVTKLQSCAVSLLTMSLTKHQLQNSPLVKLPTQSPQQCMETITKFLIYVMTSGNTFAYWDSMSLQLWLWMRGPRNMQQTPLQWRYNERDGVSKHRRFNSLLNRLFRRRSKKTSKLRLMGLCEGNPPVTGGFPSQKGQ